MSERPDVEGIRARLAQHEARSTESWGYAVTSLCDYIATLETERGRLGIAGAQVANEVRSHFQQERRQLRAALARLVDRYPNTIQGVPYFIISHDTATVLGLTTVVIDGHPGCVPRSALEAIIAEGNADV